MAYIEKGQNFVEVTFTTNIKEENPVDITKDTSDAVCDSSLPVPWENFEFVSVKEEIIDEFLTDEHCLQQKRADKLDICIEECTISSENDIFCSQPFSQNEVQDTHRKFIISSEKVSVLITQKEVEQKSSNIHHTIVNTVQADPKENVTSTDPSIKFTASQVNYSLHCKNKYHSHGYINTSSEDGYVRHGEGSGFEIKADAQKQMSFINKTYAYTENVNYIKSYRCPVCCKTFALQSNMKKHKQVHSGVKPYHCSQCMQCFTRKADLERHKGVHTNDRPYHCTVCRKSFKYKYGLSMHFKLHKGEGHDCLVCKKSFSTRHILERHKKTHAEQKIFQCSLCKAVFNERNCLTKHSRIHTNERPRPYDCHLCKKKFITRHDLERHCRTHTGEKPYQCATCEKAFSDRGDLTRHLVVHSGEKRYICTICKKAFTMQSSLKTHARVHSGDKPYSCIICKKTFSQKANVARHMKTHGIGSVQ